MKLFTARVTKGLLILGAALALSIAIASAAGNAPGTTSPPAPANATVLPSNRTLPGSHAPVVKPAGDKGIPVSIPPAPPGTFDNPTRQGEGIMVPTTPGQR